MKKVKRKPKGKVATKPPIQAVDSPTGNPERDYEAEDGLRTLVRGHEIQGNRHLMKRIKSHAKKQREAHDRVLRLEGKEL